MGVQIYDKSPTYGDLQQGFTVSEYVAQISKGLIDVRNPASVKFARIVLGTSAAIRDSLDDIASYAKKDTVPGTLSFKPDPYIGQRANLILEEVRNFITDAPIERVDAVDIAYACAIYTCAVRPYEGQLEAENNINESYKYCAELVSRHRERAHELTLYVHRRRHLLVCICFEKGLL